MAPTSTRTLWKGAITFGLVHIPIGLYSATAETGVGFEWLDRRTMDRVGYKRVNKTTGEEIAKEDIARGVKWQGDHYVILSPDEIEQAYPRTTQTIEIEAFVDADEVPFMYLERPYYVAPINRGDKVYALLREALRQTHKVGIARVVIQSKQHLAVLIPCGPALVLDLLRWGGEIRSFEALHLPPSDAQTAGVKAAELAMATQLIEGMTRPWDPEAFRNTFGEEIMKLVEAKAQAGQTAQVGQLEPPEPAPAGAEVIDLTELLRRSLSGAAPAPSAAAARSKAAPRPRKGGSATQAKASEDEAQTAAKAVAAGAARSERGKGERGNGKTKGEGAAGEGEGESEGTGRKRASTTSSRSRRAA